MLAAAVGAARLYPPASALPMQAADKFVSRVNDLTVTGPLRFTIDPHGMRVADVELAPGQSQTTALAESLYAAQVGQLVIAPGTSLAETQAFVALANAEPARCARPAGRVRCLARGRSPHRRDRGLVARL